MLQIIIRTLLIYIFIFAAVKLMGKNELAQLHPFDLVVLLLISDMASVSMQNIGMPLFTSIIPIAILTLLDIAISLLALNSPHFRQFFGGSPSILIRNGEICEQELRRQRMTIADLAQELRSTGYFAISEVDYAIMESNGEINALPKAANKLPTLSDMRIEQKQTAPPQILIADGIIDEEAIKAIGKNNSWLKKELHKAHIKDADKVFLAEWQNGEIFIQVKKAKRH